MVTNIGSGIGSSLGAGVEGAWGVFAPPTHWWEYASSTLAFKPKRIVGTGLAAGNVLQRAATRAQPSSTVEGEIKTGFYYQGMGLLLASLMGTIGSVEGTGVFGLQANNVGQSLSFQQGIPQTDGNVIPYSFQGCKVTKGMFEVQNDGFLECTFTVDGRTFDSGINGFSAPAYTLPNPIFNFSQGAFAIGNLGSEVVVEGIRKISFGIERPMAVDRFMLDGTGLKAEQIVNNFAKITMDIESDYISDAAFCRQFSLDSQLSVILSFAGAGHGVSFHVPAVRWDEGPPTVTGPDIVRPKLKLVGLNNDVTFPPAAIVYS